MQYLKFPLNDQKAGATVEVTMSGVESDVFLVDSQNLAAFERGAQFRYTGGHFKASPLDLRVPSSGIWTVVIVPGPGGSVQASVKVFLPA